MVVVVGCWWLLVAVVDFGSLAVGRGSLAGGSWVARGRGGRGRGRGRGGGLGS